jgi:hypothetical protein
MIRENIEAWEMIEITGKAGDVALLHPFLAHGRGKNLGEPRFICNPSIRLKEHMNLTQSLNDMSPLEYSIAKFIDPVILREIAPSNCNLLESEYCDKADASDVDVDNKDSKIRFTSKQISHNREDMFDILGFESFSSSHKFKKKKV